MHKKIQYVTIFVLIGVLFYCILRFQIDDDNAQDQNKNNTQILKSLIQFPELENRSEFGELLENLGYKTAIEIGVQNGEFAVELLTKWPSFEAYFGIGPFLLLRSYNKSANVNINTLNQTYMKTKAKLESIFGTKAHVIGKNSIEVVSEFKNESIDFIYIGAAFNICVLSKELEEYYPKLRCNGIIAGNDYATHEKIKTSQDWIICGNSKKILRKAGAVKEAFDEFMEKRQIKNLKLTHDSTPSFYFFKEC